MNADTELNLLRDQLKILIAERDDLLSSLTDQRLTTLEVRIVDHEQRIRPLEAGQVKSQTIYSLFLGNGLLSVIVLFKLFT